MPLCSAARPTSAFWTGASSTSPLSASVVRSSTVTSAVWPSAEIWLWLPRSSGDSTRLTVLRLASVYETSSIAARNAGSLAVFDVLWISTVSPIGCLNSSETTALTWPDSPEPALSGSSCLVPRTLPIMNAAATNASHPKMAVFLWLALQRPIRAAMLRELASGDIWWISFDWVDRRLAAAARCAHGGGRRFAGTGSPTLPRLLADGYR